MDKFVEHTPTLREVIDGNGPQCIYMSVKPSDSGEGIDLVIGAQWQNRCASSLSKSGLGQLITTLQDIHQAMKG
jgi:hypothetical protein